MPYEIIDIGTAAGTTNTRVLVRSWPTEADQIAGTRQRLETYDFGRNFMRTEIETLVTNTKGQVQLASGEFVDRESLVEEVEVRIIHPTRGELVRRVKEDVPGIELAKRIIQRDPVARITAALDKHFAAIYATDAADRQRAIDDSDPTGVFQHPGMAALKAAVRAKHPRGGTH